MKKLIVIMAVLAFGALAFGEDAPTTGATNTTTNTMDANKTGETKTEGKTAMAGKKNKKKHMKKSKTEDKAM